MPRRLDCRHACLRFWRGESVELIADQTGRTRLEVEDAIRRGNTAAFHEERIERDLHAERKRRLK